jgi:peptidoglycan hydrolase CwlO-like protein
MDTNWYNFFMKRLIIIILITILFLPYFGLKINASDKCSSISDLDDKASCYGIEKEKKLKEKNEVTSDLKDLENEIATVNSEISSLSSKLNVTQSQINQIDLSLKKISTQIQDLEKVLQERNQDLVEKTALKNLILKNYYIRASNNSLEKVIESVLKDGLGNFSIELVNQEKVNSQVLGLISSLNTEITNFNLDKQKNEDNKKNLENSFQNFLAVKSKLNSEKSEVLGTLSNLNKEQDNLEDKLEDINSSIKSLSDKQQAILREKSSEGDSGSIGDYVQPSYKLPEPPFKPAFALMSYGAFTHYNGMSQYGAKGRAEDGQDYKEILEHYYDVGVKKLDNFPSKISVKGYGEMDYQNYLYGIAEMPSDWPLEALKAQAIAARTYAYRASKPICTSESCQVYNANKAKNVPARWKKAVDETKGMILDNPKTSQYSSTTGGFLNGSGWDLKKGSWPGDAYEKLAGSPWFYKAWYTQGYSTSSSTCGRNTPWISEKEMADLLNAWVVWRKGSSKDKDRISPSVNNCFGGNPYSTIDMAERAEDFGEKYTSISSVDVEIGNNGQTTKIVFGTNLGKVTIEGQVFRTVANLRAPGYISLKSRLFDVEHRR